jgi:hypothetical protein
MISQIKVSTFSGEPRLAAGSALGMGTAALTGSGVAVVTGMITFGTGFGLAQSASLDIMLRRVPGARYSAVGAAWNAAYDLGWGAAPSAWVWTSLRRLPRRIRRDRPPSPNGASPQPAEPWRRGGVSERGSGRCVTVALCAPLCDRLWR